MESLMSSLVNYFIIVGLAFVTGTIYWVIARFRIGAVLAMVLSLAGPVLVLWLAAQRGDSTPVYEYIMAEMSNGSSWARLTVFIHIYLIGWLIFLVVILIVKLIRSPKVREQIAKIRTKKQQDDI